MRNPDTRIVYEERYKEMREVESYIDRLAPTDLSVLIRGETGTGKELAARRLHERSGLKGEFIAVNCASLTPELMAAELFGYEKGAYTGAVTTHQGLFRQADNGTLFLDEIGELTHEAQSKLLLTLQDGEVRPLGSSREVKVTVRVIAATHRNITQMIADHQFREDLYHRLHGASVRLPPLRERENDVILLAELFWQRVLMRRGIPAGDRLLEAGLSARLLGYPWPGNVRELEKAILRAQVENGSAPILSGDALLRAHPQLLIPEIRAFLETRGLLKLEEFARRMRVPAAAIKSALRCLEDEGSVVQSIGRGWRSVASSQSRSAAAPDSGRRVSREEEVLAWVRLHGAITRQDVEGMFRCSPSTAHRVLSDLLKIKALKRVRKGNSVTYQLRRRRP